MMSTRQLSDCGESQKEIRETSALMFTSRRLAQLPGEGMLSATIADQQYT
jgi:hypothetical protein